MLLLQIDSRLLWASGYTGYSILVKLVLLFIPPKPETFFASDFDDFRKCCSYVTLEKG